MSNKSTKITNFENRPMISHLSYNNISNKIDVNGFILKIVKTSKKEDNKNKIIMKYKPLLRFFGKEL